MRRWDKIKRSFGKGSIMKLGQREGLGKVETVSTGSLATRWVSEFAGRHNIRGKDTMDQMKNIVSNLIGKRLRYADLVA